MFSRFLRILLAFCCAVTLSGQNSAPAQTPYGLIAGAIIDAASNNPIRHAIVMLTLLGTHPQDAVAWTDDAGHFAFGYLPEGRYRLAADKDGYQDSRFGRESNMTLGSTIVLKTGETRNNLVIRLQHFSTISGTVTDEDGDPISGAQVLCLFAQFRHGVRRLSGWQNTQTDAQGRYKVNVQPGKYAVSVQQVQNQGIPKGSSVVSAGQPPPRPVAYVAQYYPGAEQESGAALIAVPAGKAVVGIDFHLTPKPTRQVRGRVLLPSDVSSDSLTNINVLISRADSGTGGRQLFRTGAGVNRQDYTFVTGNTPPGSYVFVAQATVKGRQFRGVERVEVGEQDVSGIQIALEPGVTVSGSVTVTGPDADKHPASRVTLVPGEGMLWYLGNPSGSVNRDGTFKITDVVPGIWDINVNPVPDGGYVKSMLLGDQDVLSEKMEITSSTAAPLKIVLATKGGQVEGDVINKAGEPMEAVVFLEPQGTLLRKIVPDYPQAMADEKGHFEFKGLDPGTYKLYAFDEWDLMSGTEGLSKFEDAGVAVQVKEAQKVTLNVQVIPAKPEATQ